ncbi:MAG: TlpA family protein disulfide reductase [Limisphaerales bacterium]
MHTQLPDHIRSFPALPRLRRVNTWCGLAALLASGLLFTASAAGWKAGEPGPDLSQIKLEGKVPENLKGKVLLLDFWASWCEPCKASFPVMDELQKRYGAQGLVVVAVNVDENRSDMEEFLKKNSVTFAVLRDAAQKLVAQAGIATMPSSFLIDRQGRVRFVHAGFRGEETRKQYEEQIETLLKN